MNSEEIEKTLHRIEGKFDLMNQKLDAIQKDTTSLEHSIYGNGQPGVKQKVIELETTVRVLKWSTMLALSIGGVVTTVLGYFLFE